MFGYKEVKKTNNFKKIQGVSTKKKKNIVRKFREFPLRKKIYCKKLSTSCQYFNNSHWKFKMHFVVKVEISSENCKKIGRKFFKLLNIFLKVSNIFKNFGKFHCKDIRNKEVMRS